MDRRLFIGLVAAGVAASCQPALAQRPGKLYRIGYFRTGEEPISVRFWKAMRELGWIEGSNIAVETRYARSSQELPRLAAQLVQSKVDLLITDSTPVALAAKSATSTIPIVFVVGGDPVASELVSSLAHPGANLTGFSYGLYEEKMLETLKAAVPGILRVAVPSGVYSVNQAILATASDLGVELMWIETPGPDAVDPFFEIARKKGAEAVLIPNMPWLNPLLGHVGGKSTRAGFPAVGPYPYFVMGGGLVSYGPAEQSWDRIAFQVDKILRGAKPGSLPVEQPTRFKTLINLKAAKALGLSLPQWLLLSADQIIDG